jgi:hypothetical protein
MTRNYVQCRLRRQLNDGAGHSEMVAYLPTHGTNGLAVVAGRDVAMATDADPRPWSILSVSESVVDATYLRRK